MVEGKSIHTAGGKIGLGDGNRLGSLGSERPSSTLPGAEHRLPGLMAGSRIATKRGEVPLHQLAAEDMLFTRDNGLQPLEGVSCRHLPHSELEKDPALYPVRISAGAFGKGVPERDMMVSPWHRMLITAHLATVIFGIEEALVAARYLVGLPGIAVAAVREATYIELACPGDQVILADGCWVEVPKPKTSAITDLHQPARKEVSELYPYLSGAQGVRNYSKAERLLLAHEQHLQSIGARTSEG